MNEILIHNEIDNSLALHYKAIVDSLTVPTFVIDNQHIVIAWNKACELLTGVKAEDVLGTNEAWRGFYPSARPCLADVVIDKAEHRLPYLYPAYGKAKFSQGLHAESWFPEINGKRRYLIFDAEPLYDENGSLVGALENLADVTEIKLAEERLALSDKVFNCINQAIMITNSRNEIIAANQAFNNLTGYTLEEVLGKNPRILSSGKQTKDFYQAMWHSISSKGHWEGDVWDRRKDGAIYPKWLSITKVTDEKTNETINYIALFSDISERKKTEEETLRLAFHDTLTGLPNRLLLRDRLQQAMIAAQRSNSLIAIMFIDLDRFKQVNDNLGHDIGDILLQEVAKRLCQCVREVDTVSRLGGDEFVILLSNIYNKEDCSIVASRILSAIDGKILIKGYQIDISPSIGISIYPNDGDNVDLLIQNADKAMYIVKKTGKNNFHYFEN